ncbi:MAG: tryptophan--tRNA ligase [Proteobacteria bacterium]|nr:tryptophan--tRNA ligase [Pseudomonadota bacterium]
MKKRSLSGIKPTGRPHLGNYLGMIKPALDLQEKYDCFYFVADYHALTTNPNPKDLRDSVHEVTASFIASGLDPDKATFFRQSDVPLVTELSWILSSCVSMGDLTRAHAYKAAKDKGIEGTLNLGVFSYPVLMAADILLYDSDVVPVGKDQIQHLEMARAMAKRFNHFYGDTLKEPLELVQAEVAVVPGIDGQKMSKSYGNGIEPFAPQKELKKQVMAIVTDSKGLEDVKDPSTCNIVALYRLLATKDEVLDMEAKYRAGNYGYGHAKLALLDKIENVFGEARKTYEKVRHDDKYLEAVLKKGADRANDYAQKLLSRVKKACGVSP